MRINLGCGATPTEEWTNYDNSFTVRLARAPILCRILGTAGVLSPQQIQFAATVRQHGIRYANVARRIPHDDHSVDVVYCSHMLEHLDRAEAELFLREVRRVLIPGGIVRLVVPDIRLLVTEYLTSGDADILVERTLLAVPRQRSTVARAKALIAGAREHMWMYDGPSLANLLDDVGFVEPQILPPGETTIIEPGALDLRERVEESVYVEAREPRGT